MVEVVVVLDVVVVVAVVVVMVVVSVGWLMDCVLAVVVVPGRCVTGVPLPSQITSWKRVGTRFVSPARMPVATTSPSKRHSANSNRPDALHTQAINKQTNKKSKKGEQQGG